MTIDHNNRYGEAPALVQIDATSAMDLNDITENGTNFVTGNPAAGQTWLQEGSQTRYGDKAFCELRLTTDDQSRFDLIFGSSIVPGRIVGGVTCQAENINEDQLNVRVEGDNVVSIDIAGSTADQVIVLGFYSDGWPDFEGYELQ